MTENFEHLIIGYLDGSLSEAEKAELLNEIASNQVAEKLFLDYKLIWDSSKNNLSDKEIHPENEFEKITHLLSDTIQSNRIQNIKPLLLKAFKYAAILIFGIVVSYYIFYSIQEKHPLPSAVTYNELIVPKGQRSQLILADGTKIWLNSDTKLRYPTGFSAEYRKVFLEGEAYFEVSKSDHIPFIVNAGILDIKVMGTTFNIRNYPDDENIETTLIEGKVSLINNEKKKEIVMAPNQQALFYKTNNSITIKDLQNNFEEQKAEVIKISKKNNEPFVSEPIISWKEEVLIINNESFKDLQIKLERWYGYSIQVKDTTLYKQRYKGKFDHHETIFQVLDAIRLTTPMKYVVNGKAIVIEKR